jgi:hypothetical protein
VLFLASALAVSAASAIQRTATAGGYSTPASVSRANLPSWPENVVPEITYGDPAPRHEWSSAQGDIDAPPPLALHASAPLSVAPAAPAVPEASFEYARPVHSGVSEQLRPNPERDQRTLRELIDLIQGGIIPELLFEYRSPVRPATLPDQEREP